MSSIQILGIIPARTGSQRIENKNFRLFSGKPLLVHSIEQALESKLIGHFVVSTNHPDIKTIVVEKYVQYCIPRPEEISHSKARGYTYVNHALEYLKENKSLSFSHFVVLPPTGPLRLTEDIDACLQKLIETGCDTVVSMVEVNQMYHGFKQKVLEEDRVKPFMLEEAGRSAYYELPDIYVRNCAIYASKIEVLKGKSLIGQDCRAYIMPPERSVDINEMIDFEFAEFLYHKTNN